MENDNALLTSMKEDSNFLIKFGKLRKLEECVYENNTLHETENKTQQTCIRLKPLTEVVDCS